MEKQIIKVTCDVCGKINEYEEGLRFGGHPLNGWFKVHKIDRSSCLTNLQAKKDWEICSIECLSNMCKIIK